MDIATSATMHQYQNLIAKALLLTLLVTLLFACSGTSSNSPDVESMPSEENEQTTPPDNTSAPPEEPVSYVDADFSDEIVTPNFENPNCPDWQADQTVEISESLTLPENCSFQRVTLQFTKPDVELNCNGALFNGLDTALRAPFETIYEENEKPHHFGFLISSHETSVTRLSNITITNCQLVNYVNSVFISMGLSPKTLASLRQGQSDEQRLRDIAPTKISVKDSRIINSHHHGIFVHRFVTDFELTNTNIKGSGNSGLYIEAGSQRSNIHDSVFEGNGFSTYSATTGTRGPRKSQNSRREGIAIDGSQFNSIRNNQFIENADGGVYLYKNCWEDSANPATLPRPEGANNNLIENNVFDSEHVGVWLAERADRNLANFVCGDPLVYEVDEEKYYRDFASENTVSNNQFSNVNTGIRVHDSNNKITDNTFVDTLVGPDIEIGSLVRNIIEDPVKNITMENNQTSNSEAIIYR